MANSQEKYILSEKEKTEYAGILTNCFEAASAFDGQEHNAFHFYKTVNLIDEFIKARNDEKISPDLEAEFAEQAGFERKHTVKWFLEDAAERAYGMMARLGDLEDVLNILESRGALIDRSDLVYVLTDQSFPTGGEGVQPLEPTEFKRQPRLSILVKELETIGVYTDDLVIRVGSIFTDKMRRLPYLIVEIPRLGKSVAVCEQYAETTFVAQNILPAYIWAGQTKKQLKARDDIQDVSFNDKWPFRVCNLLLYGTDAMTPTPGQAPPAPGPKVDLDDYELKQMAIKQPLTEEFILFHALKHFEKHGKLPSKSSGSIEGCPNEKWEMWYRALGEGKRGLPKTQNRFNSLYIKAGWKLPRLTEEIILSHAALYFLKHNKLPGQYSKNVDDLIGENWGAWNRDLTNGHRGLKGNSSLFQLYQKAGWIAGDLSVDIILKHALLYYEKHNKLPGAHSGKVEGFLGESWSGWDMALISQARGLEGESSLWSLYRKEGWLLGDLTEKIIFEHMMLYHKKHGSFPKGYSGKVDGFLAESWSSWQACLSKEHRGLKGGGTLHDILVSKGLAYKTLSEEFILEQAYISFKRTEKIPSRSSGVVNDILNETWLAFDSALKSGLRGLSEKSSLSKLFRKHGSKEIFTARLAAELRKNGPRPPST